MADWHHHHDGEHRVTFCDGIDLEDLEFGEDEECEEWNGPICDGFLPWRHPERIACRYHLAFGDYVVDVAEQLVLVAHLEAVPSGEDR